MLESIRKFQREHRDVLLGNEAQTRWLLIDIFLMGLLKLKREDFVLEYNLTDCYDDTKRIDYLWFDNGSPRFIVEAKSYGTEVSLFFNQINGYFNAIQDMELSKGNVYNQNELVCMLTDGDLYVVYTDNIEKGKLSDKFLYMVRLSVASEKEVLDFKDNVIGLLQGKNDYSVLSKSDFEYEKGVGYNVYELKTAIDFFGADGYNISSIYVYGDKKNFHSIYRLLKYIIGIKKVSLKKLLSDGTEISFIRIENGRIEYDIGKGVHIQLEQLEELLDVVVGTQNVLFVLD